MIRNPYVDLCLKVQATRRHFEGVRTPLAAAVGVAASLYTHQLANVLRVLTDVRVRHLLADEVGLGKTVQALMVLNALRYQRPGLRALVVVPDQLVTQWRDEIMTRAHTAPFESDRASEGQYIRLAWEGQLKPQEPGGKPRLALSDLDAERYDVLVVDEIHRLTGEVQSRLVKVAPEFEHLLVLTATPAFQEVRRHAQLFALLEPERTGISRARIAATPEGAAVPLSVGDDLSDWPDWAQAEVVEELMTRDREAAATHDPEHSATAAMAHCAYRRVLRTRRADYVGVVPRRSHHPLVVEPLAAEVERQQLMWQYFDHLGQLSREFKPVRLAKRVILSPPSLEQRVDYLRRKGHEREGLLEQVKPLVHRSRGDSRADALVDLLAQVWARDPKEGVLVAAQDSLTVDYLFDLVRARLPVVGPLGGRVKLVAARMRQGMTTRPVEDLGAFDDDTTKNLEAFKRGKAQVLFAPEEAQVGLNLQRARVLVLYSVPWRPQEVEQWIGRLDRIGNVAAFTAQGEARTIDVYTIAQRGLVDEKVVRVLQRFEVFERPVNLDGGHLKEVAQRIKDAGLRPQSVNWTELEDATEAMAAEDKIQELDSPLRPYLPWTVQAASRERDRLLALPPAPPVLKRAHSATGPRAWDRAFEGMLKLLEKAGEYHLRRNMDPHTGSEFRSLWYRFDSTGTWGKSEAQAKVIFSFGVDPGRDRSPTNAFAFITRRGQIGTPPRLEVTLRVQDVEARRPLRFLNFGDALHDELVKGWLPQPLEVDELQVTFPVDDKLGSALFLLRVTFLDPAEGLDHQMVNAVLRAVAGAAKLTPEKRLVDLEQPFRSATRCAMEADVRWLRAHLPPAMTLEALRREGEEWVLAGAEETTALLNPLRHGRDVPRADRVSTSTRVRRAIKERLEHCRAADATAATRTWSGRFAEFSAALQVRLLVLQEEGRDAVTLASLELQRAEGALDDAQDRGNRGQITRAENLRAAAEDKLRMTEEFWRQRLGWLETRGEAVGCILPRQPLVALLRTKQEY